jgi:hypothetical protein
MSTSQGADQNFFLAVTNGWKIDLNNYYMTGAPQSFSGLVVSITHTFPIEGRDHVRIVFDNYRGERYHVAFLCNTPRGKEEDFSCTLFYCSGATLRLYR